MRTCLPYACSLFALLLMICAFSANRQESDSTNEFWPEVNVFVNLSDRSRIFAMYTATGRENLGTYADGQTGIYFDFWALPPFRGRLIGHADSSRSKLLLLRTGYSSPDQRTTPERLRSICHLGSDGKGSSARIPVAERPKSDRPPVGQRRLQMALS